MSQSISIKNLGPRSTRNKVKCQIRSWFIFHCQSHKDCLCKTVYLEHFDRLPRIQELQVSTCISPSLFCWSKLLTNRIIRKFWTSPHPCTSINSFLLHLNSLLAVSSSLLSVLLESIPRSLTPRQFLLHLPTRAAQEVP